MLLKSGDKDRKKGGEETPRSPGPQKTRARQAREDEDVIVHFQHPSMRGAKGTGTQSFYHDGKPVKVEHEDGVVTASTRDDGFAELEAMLTAHGFARVGAEAEDKDEATAVDPLRGKKTSVTIRLAHPDLTPSNKVSAKFVTSVDGEDKTVEVKDGYVETKDAQLIRALSEKGYIVQNTAEFQTEMERLYKGGGAT